MTKLRDFLDAAYNGDLVTVKRLCRNHGLEFDVNAGDPDYFGDTALHKASEQGHFEIVQFLCEECGADVTIHSSPSSQSPQGRRPSWTAWFFEQRVIYNYLRRQEHLTLNSMSSLQVRIHGKSPHIDPSDQLETPGKEAKTLGSRIDEISPLAQPSPLVDIPKSPKVKLIDPRLLEKTPSLLKSPSAHTNKSPKIKRKRSSISNTADRRGKSKSPLRNGVL